MTASIGVHSAAYCCLSLVNVVESAAPYDSSRFHVKNLFVPYTIVGLVLLFERLGLTLLSSWSFWELDDTSEVPAPGLGHSHAAFMFIYPVNTRTAYASVSWVAFNIFVCNSSVLRHILRPMKITRAARVNVYLPEVSGPELKKRAWQASQTIFRIGHRH